MFHILFELIAGLLPNKLHFVVAVLSIVICSLIIVLFVL